MRDITAQDGAGSGRPDRRLYARPSRPAQLRSVNDMPAAWPVA